MGYDKVICNKTDVTGIKSNTSWPREEDTCFLSHVGKKSQSEKNNEKEKQHGRKCVWT